jgi:hypothetical protein
MKMHKIVLACLLALGAATPALAIEPKNQVTPVTVNSADRAGFQATAGEVRAGMVEGGRFEFVTATERATIEEAFRKMDLLFQANESVAAMNKTDQVALFNEQETVNAILKNKDSDRIVCKREKKLGSNLGQTQCMSFGERERMRRDSQNLLNQMQKGHASTHQ